MDRTRRWMPITRPAYQRWTRRVRHRQTISPFCCRNRTFLPAYCACFLFWCVGLFWCVFSWFVVEQHSDGWRIFILILPVLYAPDEAGEEQGRYGYAGAQQQDYHCHG